MSASDSSAAPDTDPTIWIRRGVFVAVLVVGWVFIVWSNKFHVTAPVVFVCLGYLAVISTVYNLWRTGAAVASSDQGTWGRPLGARGELEKEKKTLLKAIKEAEFDHAMGKLSRADAEELILSYRARAIEVIKELDRVEAGAALSTRDQIAREVKARIELASSDKPSKRAKNAVEANSVATAAEVKAAKSDAQDALVDAVEATAAGKPESPREPRPSVLPDAPVHVPMPGKLIAVLVSMLAGVVANFASSAVVSGGIELVLIVGLLAGNDGVRTFLRGFAVILMFWFVSISVADGTPTQHSLMITGVSLIGPAFLTWALGQRDVRDWMFRKNFKLDVAEAAPSKADVKAARTAVKDARDAEEAEAEAADVKTTAATTTEAAAEPAKAEAT